MTWNWVLEVRAKSDEGFDESTRRTVSENARSLGAQSSEFEQMSLGEASAVFDRLAGCLASTAIEHRVHTAMRTTV